MNGLKIQNSKFKNQKVWFLVFVICLFAGTAHAQDFGIYSLSAKTNLDSTDALMLMQKVDSAYYKLLWDRVVDSVEDSVRGKIMNNWIHNSAAISLSKLATGTAGYVVLANGSGNATYTNLTGDVTINSSGVTTIGSSAVGSSEITNNTIVNDDINSSAAIAYSKLNLTGSIVNADISTSAAIALSKLATSTAGNVIVYNSGGVPTSVTMSGDATITDAGVVDLADALSDNFTFSGSVAFSAYSATFEAIDINPYEITILTGGAQTINALNRSLIVFSDFTYGDVSITDFTNEVEGQVLTVVIPTSSYYGFTVINNGSKIILNGSLNSLLGVGSTISFVSYGGIWYETGRIENDLGY